jgi:cell wall assembly regulator SMI1
MAVNNPPTRYAWGSAHSARATRSNLESAVSRGNRLEERCDGPDGGAPTRPANRVACVDSTVEHNVTIAQGPNCGRRLETERMTVEESWSRIESWMQRHAPEALDALRSGARASRIADAERALGFDLPDAFRRSLLRHDGQEWRWPSLIEFGILMPLDAIVEAAHLNEEYGIENVESDEHVWWRRGWVPFVSRDGDFLSLALGSSAQAAQGEVWCFLHDNDQMHSLIAPDFEAWLAAWADELEAGVFQVDRAPGAGLLPRAGQASRLWPDL